MLSIILFRLGPFVPHNNLLYPTAIAPSFNIQQINSRTPCGRSVRSNISHIPKTRITGANGHRFGSIVMLLFAEIAPVIPPADLQLKTHNHRVFKLCLTLRCDFSKLREDRKCRSAIMVPYITKSSNNSPTCTHKKTNKIILYSDLINKHFYCYCTT